MCLLIETDAASWCPVFDSAICRACMDQCNENSYIQQKGKVYRRGALRVACASWTVSYDAACVVARKCCRERQKQSRGCSAEPRRLRRMEAVTERLRRWSESDKGLWTFRLLPDIFFLVSREYGEIIYCLTQLLMGHRCFRASKSTTKGRRPYKPCGVLPFDILCFKAIYGFFVCFPS